MNLSGHKVGEFKNDSTLHVFKERDGSFYGVSWDDEVNGSCFALQDYHLEELEGQLKKDVEAYLKSR